MFWRVGDGDEGLGGPLRDTSEYSVLGLSSESGEIGQRRRETGGTFRIWRFPKEKEYIVITDPRRSDARVAGRDRCASRPAFALLFQGGRDAAIGIFCKKKHREGRSYESRETTHLPCLTPCFLVPTSLENTLLSPRTIWYISGLSVYPCLALTAAMISSL